MTIEKIKEQVSHISQKRRDRVDRHLWTDTKPAFDKQHQPSNINQYDLNSVKGLRLWDEATKSQRERLFLSTTVSNETTTEAKAELREFIDSRGVATEAKNQKNTWYELH